ncbi:hypothetical protein H5410_041094, partial [Solanum commersonii]
MPFCGHYIFGNRMPSTDPWHVGETNVTNQLRFRVVYHKLIWGKKGLHLLSLMIISLREMHLARCYDMVNFEIGISTLRVKYDETIQPIIRIELFEAKSRERVE